MYFMGHWFIDKFKNNVRVELTTDSCRTERSHTTETLKLHLTHGNWSSKYFIGNKILNSYGQLGDIIFFFFTYVAFGESKAVRQYLQCEYFKTMNELSQTFLE